MTREFESKPATRERVPVLVGLVGPSGGGKTKSALRLADGMQRVTGGETYVVDTEGKRALHYADQHSFRHVVFDPPFGSLDYLAAIEHCVKQGATTVIVDSMSHEHEGPGGVLEQHDTELDRIAGQDYGKRQRMTFSAWAKPKADRRRLINTILQLQCNMIFCFRAKPKIKIRKGQDPLEQGWMAIAGEEFIYEMTINMLLPPACDGKPDWFPTMPGEQMQVKLPMQFKELFSGDTRQLDEDAGEAMAQWGAGDVTRPSDDELTVVLAAIQAAPNKTQVAAVARKHKGKAWDTEQRSLIKANIDNRTAQLNEEEGPAQEGAA
jgi:ABC-type dipeptide/oligopeptide/nickel transport system ATPase subunit